MTSVIIPYKGNIKTKDTELIYAIRGFQKHLKGIGDIYIIGNRLSSLQGLKYIQCRDDQGSKWKERNIYRKILAACKDERVSEDFIFANDDHMITKDYEVAKLPFYHKNTLEGTMENNKGDYRKSLNHTRKFLISKGKETWDYDTHFPIVYNKQKFIDTFAMEGINWDMPFTYVLKSMYGNLNNVEGEFGGDCKIHSKMNYEEIKRKVGDKSFFSTSDGSINEDMIRFLNELYPQPSFYER